MNAFHTADLLDAHPDLLVVEGCFRDFGGHASFHGSIATVALFEDNSLVREAVSTAGAGRVLVVDGGGSLRRALLGDRLGARAVENGWAGLLIHGCVRDCEELARLALGIRALGTHPRKSAKRGEGRRDTPVSFGGVTFRPGQHLYADPDGILVSPHALEGP